MLGRTAALYGEDVEMRIRAHVLLDEPEAAKQLIRESPFLNGVTRARLRQLLTDE